MHLVIKGTGFKNQKKKKEKNLPKSLISMFEKSRTEEVLEDLKKTNQVPIFKNVRSMHLVITAW